MTIQEAKEFFATSDFSEETKKKIAAVFEGKRALDEKVLTAVKALMQEELNKDFAESGVTLTEAQENEAAGIYAKELEKVDTELAEDTKFVETELKALDDVRKKMMTVSDAIDADAIRASI